MSVIVISSDSPTFTCQSPACYIDAESIDTSYVYDSQYASTCDINDPITVGGGTDGVDGSDGTDGRGIVSIVRTSGDGSPGTTDTYTITYTDSTTSTFDVYNGANGATGDTGATGPQGDPGADGADGADGTDGATITTGTDVPTGGNNGDLYIRTTNYDLYEKQSGVWNVIGNVKGATGSAGADGSDGSDGDQWTYGSSIPSSTAENTYDEYYIYTINYDVYLKTAGTTTWSVVMNIAGSKYATTSTTSVNLSTVNLEDSVVLTVADDDMAYTGGQYLVVAYSSDSTNQFTGMVTAYSGTSVTLTVKRISGSGTYASWNVNLSGIVDSSTDFNHNDLGSIDGGTSGEYYHTTVAQWNAITNGNGSVDDAGTQHTHTYADLLSLPTLTTFSNGITETASVAKLGGTLTENTTIDGSSGLYDLNLNNLDSFNISFDNVSTVTDSGTNGGLRYAGDYSGNYVSRSIVDKEYVDTVVAGSVTSVVAGNGMDFTTITTTGSVTMGTPGTLTSATTDAVTTTSHTHAITTGIADTNIVKVDDASAADDEYVKFTANGVEGRTYAEVKTDLSLDNVENTALSTWGGTTNITTLGTITTGTWNGTTIAIANGGTGQTTQQAAIDALTNVSGATNEYVLTKDTASGNAIWKSSVSSITNDVLEWSTDKYTPYASNAAGVFATEAAYPSTSDRLNWNGNFYANNYFSTNYYDAGNSATDKARYDTGQLWIMFSSTQRLLMTPGVSDGASAVAYTLDTANTLSTAGAKILSLKNAGSEKLYIDKGGIIYAPNLSNTSKSDVVYYDSATGEFTYNTAPSGASVAGSSGDFQINNSGSLGTVSDIDSNHEFSFDGTNYIIGDYNSTSKNYLYWQIADGGMIELAKYGTGSEFNSVYLKNGDGYLDTRNSSNYGGAFNISDGLARTEMIVYTASGQSNLQLYYGEARLTNPDPSSWGSTSLVNKDYVDKEYMKVERAQVLYTNTTQTTIITLPADAVIWRVGIGVVTTFNDSGTDLLDVGTTATGNKYVDNNNVSNLTFGDSSSQDGLDGYQTSSLPERMTGSTNITFQYTGQNSDATQGEAYVYVHYTLF